MTLKASFAKLGATASIAALATGCAMYPVSSVMSGVHPAYTNPLGKAYLNGWEPVPGTQLVLDGQYPPRIASAGTGTSIRGKEIVLTRDTSMQALQIDKQCSQVTDRTRYVECVHSTVPREVLFEQPGVYLVFAELGNCRPVTGKAQRAPGTGEMDTYFRAACTVTGNYSVKSNRGPFDANGQPARVDVVRSHTPGY